MSWRLVVVTALGACANTDHESPPANDAGYGSLIDHTRWVALDAEGDPFTAHRPEAVDCPDWSRQIEGALYEVETGDCNYASLSQTTLRPIRAGDRVDAVLWHLWLWAPQVAEAHVAIQIGDWLFFEETVAIPGPEQSYSPSGVAPKDFPLGTPVVFHLHNHGVNSWRLLSIEVAAP